VLKKKSLQILLVGICLVSLIAVWLGYNWMRNPDSTFEIMTPKGYSKSIDFGDLDLIPGESRQYDIDLTSKLTSKNYIVFSFEKSADSPLAEYIYCEMKIGDKLLCDTRLDNLLDGRALPYTANMKIGEPIRVDVRFYMPSSVTNEAQNKTASIRLNINATNEKPLGE